MSNLRLVVEIFDGIVHFSMWQGEVLVSLSQQGLDIAIEEEKLEDLEYKDWSIINQLASGQFNRACPKRKSMLSRMRLLCTNCERH